MVNQANYLPRLIMIQGQAKGHEFYLNNIVTIGREPSNTITIPEPKASRRHARVYFQNGEYWIEDMKSGNGTFVNGMPKNKVILRDKDLVRIADTILMFRNPQNYKSDKDHKIAQIPVSPLNKQLSYDKTQVHKKPATDLFSDQVLPIEAEGTIFEESTAKLDILVTLPASTVKLDISDI